MKQEMAKLKDLSPQGQIVTALIEKFPESPVRMLARMAYKECPEAFTDYETARGVVRYHLGLSGERNRKPNSPMKREKKESSNVFPALPKAKTVFDAAWRNFSVPGANRVLNLADIHIPFHDLQALKIAIEYGVKWNPSIVLLNGDALDFYACSDFLRHPKFRKFSAERDAFVQFLAHLRAKYPKSRIIYKLGNHEDRFDRYMMVKAPELFDMPDYQIDKLLKLDEFGVELVKDMRPIKIGKLYVLHGHEYRFPLTDPVNPARGIYNKAKALCCCGHFHRTSQHQEKGLNDNVVRTWSSGCLCDLHPQYRPLNNWSHGFITIEVDGSGAFELENRQIIDGKVY